MTEIIQAGSRVSVQYNISVDGSILEDSQKSSPLNYIHGKGKILRGFIRRLEGLKAGDKRNFELPPEEAHGPISDSAIQEVRRSDLPVGINPKVGMKFKMKNRAGEIIRVKVIEENENTVMLDNNHPMAGKTLVIQVQILTVE